MGCSEGKFGFYLSLDFLRHTITTRPIKALKPIDYISFFRTLTKGRQMTRKRFNDMKSILNGIIYFAIEKGMIDHNPLNDINYRQFSYKAENNNVMPYNENERSMILNHLGNDIYSLAIKLDFHLILRIGELKALKWSDINGNFIYVQRFMNDKNVIVEDIKGHQSEGRRYIPLTESAHRILGQIKDINPNSEYLFVRDGIPLATCTFNRHIRKCCDELNIPYRSSHKVRFSTASILYKNGVSSPELQRMLGHTDLNMTNHYLRNVTSTDETYGKMSAILG